MRLRNVKLALQSWKGRIALLLLVAVSLYSARPVYNLVRWKAYIWVPSYVCTSNPDEAIPDAEKHLIFVMVDHYEPGKGERGARINRQWLETFRPISAKHVDSYGNSFRYTWFYPYEQRNEEILKSLCKMAYDGYGEVELHWHHPPATSKTFPGMLDEAIKWFQRYGALISSGEQPQTHFAFIHGNWALDNSQPRCGVNNEIHILFKAGCYADFTFSTISTVSQPRKVNAIYYVTDTDEPKSYDDGVDAQVGNPVDDRLMIFEGPISMDWRGRLEYGAVEYYGRPNTERIERWIDTNIHVIGRPEWVFVKVYSHGVQSRNVIVDADLDTMLASLKRICGRRGISLHYMTAREAYNVVKAAEDDLSGDPEDYRDYKIAKPCNMLFQTDVPVVIERITKSEQVFSQVPRRSDGQ